MSSGRISVQPDVDLSVLLASPRLPALARAINDRLRDEAERRPKFYEEMSEDVEMELINGTVILLSPVTARHVQMKNCILHLLQSFVIDRDLGQVMDGRALCVFPRNDYEPDIVFFGPEKATGIGPETMKFPVPDLVVEVLSESTEHRDRGVKFQDYEAHGVREYWIVEPDEGFVEQYVERGGRYELRVKSGSGEIESVAVPGFRAPIAAFFDEKASLRAMRSLLDQQSSPPAA